MKTVLFCYILFNLWDQSLSAATSRATSPVGRGFFRLSLRESWQLSIAKLTERDLIFIPTLYNNYLKETICITKNTTRFRVVFFCYNQFRFAAPMIPASFLRVAMRSSVFFSSRLVYCILSTSSRKGAIRFSPSFDMPPPMLRMSGWKILMMFVNPQAR